MEISDATRALTALGHPGRLAVYRLLMRHAPQPMRPTEIAAALDLHPSTLSVYLSALTETGLIARRRAGRELRYQPNTGRMGELIRFLAGDCCLGRPEFCLPLAAPARPRPDRPLRVLFLCRQNAGRSLMAEAILNALGQGRLSAASAGTRPAAQPHPGALAALAARGWPGDGLWPKPPEAVPGPFQIAITLCDRAADEDCAPLPGQPIRCHWGMADPAADPDPDAFARACDRLERQIAALVAADWARLDAAGIQALLDRLALDAVPA